MQVVVDTDTRHRDWRRDNSVRVKQQLSPLTDGNMAEVEGRVRGGAEKTSAHSGCHEEETIHCTSADCSALCSVISPCQRHGARGDGAGDGGAVRDRDSERVYAGRWE